MWFSELVDFFKDLPIWAKVPIELIAIGVPFLAHELHKANELCDQLIASTKRKPSFEEDPITGD